jgi:hypothetical protein
VRVFVAVGLVIGLVSALADVAAASTKPSYHLGDLGGRPAAAGTVTSAPAGNVFSISTRFGATVTVDVTATTVYVERGVSSPTLDNVSPGELVAVFGTVSGATVTAAEVFIVQPSLILDLATAGIVRTGPTSTGFTIVAWNRKIVTVEVTPMTAYAQYGVSHATLENVSRT